jgi:outer membrane murein-binding lipoprotein Lpp
MVLYAIVFACGVVAGVVAQRKLAAPVATDVAAAKAAVDAAKAAVDAPKPTTKVLP